MRWTKDKPGKPGYYWMRNRIFVGVSDKIVHVIKDGAELLVYYKEQWRPLGDVGNNTALWSDVAVPKPMIGPGAACPVVGKSELLRDQIRSKEVGSFFDFDGRPQAARRAASSMGATIETRKLDGCGYRVWINSKPETESAAQS